jgi:hypothetical protein
MQQQDLAVKRHEYFASLGVFHNLDLTFVASGVVDSAVKPQPATSSSHSLATTPHLMNLSDDALLCGSVAYPLPLGITRVGTLSASKPQNIPLGGLLVRSQHCLLQHSVKADDPSKSVVIVRPGRFADVFINGRLVTHDSRLHHGDRSVTTLCCLLWVVICSFPADWRSVWVICCCFGTLKSR